MVEEGSSCSSINTTWPPTRRHSPLDLRTKCLLYGASDRAVSRLSTCHPLLQTFTAPGGGGLQCRNQEPSRWATGPPKPNTVPLLSGGPSLIRLNRDVTGGLSPNRGPAEFSQQQMLKANRLFLPHLCSKNTLSPHHLPRGPALSSPPRGNGDHRSDAG